jgi:hypothetical protein
LPSYLDTSLDPAVPAYYYHVTGVSQFFLPGNSTPRIVESPRSDPAVAAAGKVIIALRPAKAKPGKRAKLQLSIENATGVAGAGMQLRIAYDPATLVPWTQASPGSATVLATGLSRNLDFTDNGATAAGELVIDGTGGQLEPGSGKLFTLQFEVAAGVPKDSPIGINVAGGTMFDLDGHPLAVETMATDPPESGDAYFPGDLDGDGFVTTADKDLLKELLKPKASPPTAEQLMAGDLSADGKLSEKDLVLLMQMLNAP